MIGLQEATGPGWYYKGKIYPSTNDLHDAMEKEIESLKLQVRELQDLLWEIGNEDVGKPMSREESLKILKLLNKTNYIYTEKQDHDKVVCGNCCQLIPSEDRTKHGPGKCPRA